ncbi:uncharacterized protein V6R79_000146 [Siganus canaliculatus]
MARKRIPVKINGRVRMPGLKSSSAASRPVTLSIFKGPVVSLFLDLAAALEKIPHPPPPPPPPLWGAVKKPSLALNLVILFRATCNL